GRAYLPNIDVSIRVDESGRRWLDVQDNGFGMDEHVLSEYFLKLGNSYYRSPEFVRLPRNAGGRPFTPISRFGIGLASVFMIGDSIEVVTRNGHSPRRDYQARRVRIDKLGALVFMTEAPADVDGTLVSVRLSAQLNGAYEQFAADVEHYLKNVVIGPRFPVTLRMGSASIVLKHTPIVVLSPGASDFLARKGLEIVVLDVARWSDVVAGTVAVLFAKTPSGLLSHLRNGQYLRIGPALDPTEFLMSYSGNRISVNGFRMGWSETGK
ncbi:MAG TPA: ATP-binding protein, partial [Candidatus Acidoferrales bacterium]|nr:ATP-binding protein [Candidatus Acidoferrales bacterium]